MKILIFSLGSVGRRHLRNLKGLGERYILPYQTRRASLPDDELAGPESDQTGRKVILERGI
ncbi:MAG TPA: hypothetical protein VII97_01680 [Anaerolineales bacterium]